MKSLARKFKVYNSITVAPIETLSTPAVNPIDLIYPLGVIPTDINEFFKALPTL